ncbi:MAG: foldase [Bacteroidetes bacterium]|nr:MAG: foldase [Bacteroidota bacterium]
MALMNTLRNKMGKVVVGMISFAILAFVFTDLKDSFFSNGNDRSVGEIAGESVDVEEYQKILETLKVNYQNNFGRSPGEVEMRSLRDQAWQFLVVEKAFAKVFDNAGVEVGTDELFDMVQGKNVSTDIQQIFTNPQTGQFDKNRLIQTIASLNTSPQGRAQWAEFERNLIPGRLRIKYDNLLEQTSIVSKYEAEQEYKAQSSVAEAKYLYIPFYAIADSTVTASDSEMNAYIKNHADDYKAEWSRSIKYVDFPIIPTSEDSLFYRDELREIKEEFLTVKDDSVYAALNTDEAPFFAEYAINQLPVILRSNINILNKDDVIGPYIDNGNYVLYKISDVIEGSTGYARASHILIKWEDDSDAAKTTARTEALGILRDLQNGADFSETAKDKSKDGGSAIRGGDLDWFDSDRMVKPFSDAVFGATSKGLISSPVESEFGYHIIKVTELPSYTKYKISMVRREIMASDETRDYVFRKADYFAGTSDNLNDFTNNSGKDTLVVLEADNISKNDTSVPRIDNARQIVTWLFNTASEGQVSQVFEIDDQYIVAVMTSEVEEGTADLESVRLEVEQKVKNEKKEKLIADKVAALSGTLEERKESFGNDATVYESSDIKLSSLSLPSVGTSPDAIGTLFAMQSGEFSKPIATENGVVILNLINVTHAPEIADYTSYRNTLEQGLRNRASFYIGETIREWASIEDKRYKFY